MDESNDLPKYLKVSLRNRTANKFDPKTLWVNGKNPQKRYCPDRACGVSYEFPTNLKTQHELIDPMSAYNPFIDEKQVISSRNKSSCAYRKLLKNKSHNNALTNKVPGASYRTADLVMRSFIEHNATVDPDKVNSVSAFKLLQNFNIKETGCTLFKTFIKLPQRKVNIRNPINDSETEVQPPPVNVEVYSHYRDKYF